MSPAERERLVFLGETRALVYRVGAYAGLRRGEMQRVRRCDVDLEHSVIRVPAASAKSRKDQTVPLRGDLAEALRVYLARAEAMAGEAVAVTDPLFPTGTFPTIRTYQADLEAAGIAYKDAQGRVVDFHAAGRVTLATRLSAAGVHPRVAQAVLRHASIELTMQTYTDAAQLDTRAAVEALGGAEPTATTPEPDTATSPMTPPSPAAGPARAVQGDDRYTEGEARIGATLCHGNRFYCTYVHD